MKAISIGPIQINIRDKRLYVRCPHCVNHFIYLSHRRQLKDFYRDHHNC